MKLKEYLIYIILKILNLLPFRFQQFLGKFIGSIFYILFKERREIARWNLSKCFPKKNSKDIDLILRKNFSNIGQSLFEFLVALWFSDEKIKNLIINYEDTLQETAKMKSSKGKLILFIHNPNLDLVGRIASLFFSPISAMARTQNIKIIDNLFKKSREKFTERIFNPGEVRSVLDHLKKGNNCLYAPDQDYGYKSSIFIEFFGHKALTVKFPSISVRIANCDVYIFSLEKRKLKYKIFLKKLEITGESLEDDLKEINSSIEEYIKSNLDNYLWSHRRFKNRPDGEEHFYPKALLRKR